MIVMNPYHAYESPVGHVFDVAKWCPRKSLLMGIFSGVLGVLLAVAVAFLLSPDRLGIEKLAKELPRDFRRPVRSSIKDLNRKIRKLERDYPKATNGAIGAAGVLALVFIVGGRTFIVDSRNARSFYFRAGPGGMSIRVPDGVDYSKLCMVSKILEFDMPWSEIEQWAVIQKKQFGALSPNAGNLDATLKVRMVSGKKHRICLDDFREPARIIYKRIHDAMEMVPAQFDSQSTEPSGVATVPDSTSPPIGDYSAPQKMPEIPT